MIGVILVLVGAVTAMAASGEGGVIWTGGLLVGGTLLIKSLAAYRRSRSLAMPGLSPEGWVGVMVGLAACLMVGGAAGVQFLEAQEVASEVDDVGSCWRNEGGDELLAVSCSGDGADYVAEKEVPDPADCPSTSVIYVEGRPGHYLCLAPGVGAE